MFKWQNRFIETTCIKTTTTVLGKSDLRRNENPLKIFVDYKTIPVQ